MIPLLLVSIASVAWIFGALASGDDDIMLFVIPAALVTGIATAALVAIYGNRTGVHMAVPGVTGSGLAGMEATGCLTYVLLVVFPMVGAALYIFRSPLRSGQGGFCFSGRGFNSSRIKSFVDSFYQQKALFDAGRGASAADAASQPVRIGLSGSSRPPGPPAEETVAQESAPAGQTSESVEERLEKLKGLLDKGLIDQAISDLRRVRAKVRGPSRFTSLRLSRYPHPPPTRRAAP